MNPLEPVGRPWLDERLPSLGGRAEAFSALWDALTALQRPVVIVETGATREVDNWAGDGQSTRVWDALVTAVGGEVWTCDIDATAVEVTRSLVSARVQVHHGDSLAWLPRLSQYVVNKFGQADLLYLDSYDIDWDNPRPSTDHHRAELDAAWAMLGPGSIVAVDDNRQDIGKGIRVGLELVRRRWQPMLHTYVRAWRHP